MLKENETLIQAAREMSEARVHRDVLERAEAAILPRVGHRPTFMRPLLVSATGLAALAIGVSVLAPVRASAAEILRIAGNGDRGLRHVEISTVQPDGSLSRAFQMDLEDGKRRFEFTAGDVAVYDGRALYRLRPGGSVTIERSRSGFMGEEGSAADLLSINATSEGTRLSVQRGKVDRYTIDRDLKDAQGVIVHLNLVLEADPKTQRPLSLRAKTEGYPERVTTWSYPAPNPALFRPLIPPNGRVYDLDAQRNMVLSGLRGPGRKAALAGKTVELVGLWVDEFGNASAVARADYAYPADYGLKIEGFKTRNPEKPPFSGQWVTYKPAPFEGRSTQVFRLLRPNGVGRFHYPDRVNVQLPVCDGKRLLGYVRFEGVPVHRAYQTDFLQPDNRSFWDTSPRQEGAEAKAVEEKSQP